MHAGRQLPKELYIRNGTSDTDCPRQVHRRALIHIQRVLEMGASVPISIF